MDRILRLGSGGIPGVGQVSYNLWSKSLNLVVSAVDNRTLKRSIACQTNRLMLRNVLGTLGNYYYRGNKLTFCQLHVQVTVASFYFLSVSEMESRSMALMHM